MCARATAANLFAAFIEQEVDHVVVNRHRLGWCPA
jgi:hypothetical protein